MGISAVLFDFNGVIIDDEPVHNEAWREVLIPLGIDYTDEEYYGPLLGVPDAEFLRLLLERRGIEVSTPEQMDLLAVKSKIYNRLVLERPVDPPGLVDFVRDLAAHAPLGIVSGALREEIVMHTERLGIAGHFVITLAAGQYEMPKPDPAPYLGGLNALVQATGRPVNAGEVLVIEDSENGVLSAKGAGMPVMGITRRIPAERLDGCFFTADDFSGLTYKQLSEMLD